MKNSARKTTTSLISLLLAVLMMFCLSACGANTTNNAPTIPSKNQADTTSKNQADTTQSIVEVITEGTPGLVFQSNRDGTECFVSDYTGEETNVVIPTVYKGIPVTSIGEKAFSRYDVEVKSVYIPNSIKGIGERAFYGCEITEIIIPDSVSYIKKSAFQSCNNLASIQIPSSVTSIGEDAFSYCFALKEITIPSSVKNIGNRCFKKSTNLTDIYCEAPMEPSSWAKYWREGMPSGVTVHWDCN